MKLEHLYQKTRYAHYVHTGSYSIKKSLTKVCAKRLAAEMDTPAQSFKQAVAFGALNGARNAMFLTGQPAADLSVAGGVIAGGIGLYLSLLRPTTLASSWLSAEKVSYNFDTFTQAFAMAGATVQLAAGSGVAAIAADPEDQGQWAQWKPVVEEYGILGLPQYGLLHLAEKKHHEGRTALAQSCLVGATLLNIAIEPARFVSALSVIALMVPASLVCALGLACANAYSAYRSPQQGFHEYSAATDDLQPLVELQQQQTDTDSKVAWFTSTLGDHVDPQDLDATRNALSSRGANAVNDAILADGLSARLQSLSASASELDESQTEHLRALGDQMLRSDSSSADPARQYRRKALNLHPDRLGRGNHELTTETRGLARAVLDVYASARDLMLSLSPRSGAIIHHEGQAADARNDGLNRSAPGPHLIAQG